MKVLLYLLILSACFSNVGKNNGNFIFEEPFPEDVKKKILEDLKRLKNIEGISTFSYHDKIFGKLKGKSLGDLYYNYIVARIKYVKWISKKGAPLLQASDPNFPYGIYVNSSYKHAIDTEHEEWVNYIERMNILIHEARHNENFLSQQQEVPNHINCLKGELKDKSACDESDKGAYAAGIVFLRNLEKNCSNCKKIEKEVAGALAKKLLERIHDSKSLKEELWSP